MGYAEPKGLPAVWTTFPEIPPIPPLPKGGQGGFLKSVANLLTFSILRDYPLVNPNKPEGLTRRTSTKMTK
jgi:hypothetical protein